MAETVVAQLDTPEIADLEQQATLKRRADSLRTLRFGWLGIGLIALISLLFFPLERSLAAVILATTVITFLTVTLLQNYRKTQLAGWVFVIAVDLSFLGFFLVEIQQRGAAEAFQTQVTFLA